jgi:protein-L-isoaspartate(D-aspartate) O-methyltransferase
MRRGWLFVCIIIFVVSLKLFVARDYSSTEGGADAYTKARHQMVETQMERRGIINLEVLRVLRKVPRHEFVPLLYRWQSYDDHPLPIGEGQTISQPYIVALMTELLDPKLTDRILEIGTGSGYQAAILAELVDTVYTIEIIPALAKNAEETFKHFGYSNIQVKAGDGYLGWPEEAPFDGIIVTAAPPYLPQPLVEQLKTGGKLVIPVGDIYQELKVYTKTEEGIDTKDIIPVQFVPMTGRAQEK